MARTSIGALDRRVTEDGLIERASIIMRTVTGSPRFYPVYLPDRSSSRGTENMLTARVGGAIRIVAPAVAKQGPLKESNTRWGQAREWAANLVPAFRRARAARQLTVLMAMARKTERIVEEPERHDRQYPEGTVDQRLQVYIPDGTMTEGVVRVEYTHAHTYSGAGPERPMPDDMYVSRLVPPRYRAAIDAVFPAVLAVANQLYEPPQA